MTTTNSTVDEASIQATVWKTLATHLARFDRSAQDLVRAAERLVTEGSRPALLEAGVTDRVDRQARAVRLFGPNGSGKTTCARRIVRQAISDGRQVTVFHSSAGKGKQEYMFTDVDGTLLTVIDAEQFCTPKHGDRDDERKRAQALEGLWSDFSTGPAATVIVDAWLPAADLHDLTTQLHRALSQRAETTLVVLVSHPDTLEQDRPPIPFDTEILLPGDQYVDRHSIHKAVRRLSDDDLTCARLEARALGGGAAESRLEQQIIDWFTPLGPEERLLARNRSRVIEPPLGAIPVGSGPASRTLRHGLIKGIDGALAEFSLTDTHPLEPRGA